MQVIKNNVSLEATPTSDTHVINKKYVDGKQVTISWAEYQALSEEEKNNGTAYYIPDMPVSARGEVIGEVERLNGRLTTDVTNLEKDSIIPFVADGRSNMKMTNGLVTLKKGKLYSIFCDCLCKFTQVAGGVTIGIKDTNNTEYGSFCYDLPTGYSTSTGTHTSFQYTISPTEDITICAYIRGCENLDSIYSRYSKLIITEIPSYQGLIDVSDQHIKEVATSLKYNWYTKDISLSSNLSEWGNETITVSEIINSKKVMLYDGTNQSWTPVFENIGEVIGMIYTNGLGVTDGYNFSQKIHVDFTNGNVMNISMRTLTSTGNPPNFTKIAYYK